MDKNLETRVKMLEAGSVTTWGHVLKVIWPLLAIFISATIFLLVNIYNKAPAATVNEHSGTIKEHSIKIENYEKRLKWLTDTTFDIAKALGINPSPPP